MSDKKLSFDDIKLDTPVITAEELDKAYWAAIADDCEFRMYIYGLMTVVLAADGPIGEIPELTYAINGMTRALRNDRDRLKQIGRWAAAELRQAILESDEDTSEAKKTLDGAEQAREASEAETDQTTNSLIETTKLGIQLSAGLINKDKAVQGLQMVLETSQAFSTVISVLKEMRSNGRQVNQAMSTVIMASKMKKLMDALGSGK